MVHHNLAFSGLAHVPEHASWAGDVLIGSKTGRFYDPMEQPGLFRVVADLEKTDHAIQEFALRWGVLSDRPLYRDDWFKAVDEIATLTKEVTAKSNKSKDIYADLGDANCQFTFEQGQTICHLPDLLTCLKVQVALAASEGLEFVPCEFCGAPFVKTGRKRFCSTLCRVKAHQEKKAGEDTTKKKNSIGGVGERQKSYFNKDRFGGGPPPTE